MKFRSAATKILAAALAIFFCTIGTAGASPESQSLVTEGRDLIFGAEAPTYGDIVTAKDKFAQAVAADSTDKEAQLFYGVTRIAAFMLENGPGGLSTGADLLNLFGIYIAPDNAFGDLPVGDFPELYDSYDPPATIPMGETVRAFLADQLVPEIDAALANLAAVGNGFTLALDTGDGVIDIDDGDVLVIRSGLLSLKAMLLIATAYDMDIDLHEFCVLANAEVLEFQKILDANPNLLALRSADGQTQLDTARTSLLDAITTAQAAYDFIDAEPATDPQDDDLFYFGSAEEQNQALEELIKLTELHAALVENRPAAITTATERWSLTNNAEQTIELTSSYATTGAAGAYSERPVDGILFWGIDGCNWVACSGWGDHGVIDGDTITWYLTSNGASPPAAELTGVITGDSISGSYTTNYGDSGTFTGTRVQSEVDTETYNPNAAFGSATQNPLDIRAALPKFGPEDAPVAGTFPTNGDGDAFNGIVPGMTNASLAEDGTARHQTSLDGTGSSAFTIPIVLNGSIAMDGSMTGDWANHPEAKVFDDFVGDELEGTPPTGTDVEAAYMAMDDNFYYFGVKLADGAPPAQWGMSYVFETMWGSDDWGQPLNMLNSAQYDFMTGQWFAQTSFRGLTGMGWTGTSDDVGVGDGFVEWRAPRSLQEEPFLPMIRYLRVMADASGGMQPFDDNITQIKLNLTSVSVNLGCTDCNGSGKFYIYASQNDYPGHPWDVFDQTYQATTGTFSLDQMPIGLGQTYLHVLYDADDNGIRSFGDRVGVSGPLTVAAGGATPTVQLTADISVDDDFILTKPGVYRVFGFDQKPLWEGFWGPWNPNDITWLYPGEFLGEFADTATIETTKFYKYILILWHGDRQFRFDSLQDLTAGTAFGQDEDGQPVSAPWTNSGLSSAWQFIGGPDGVAAATEDLYGFSLMEMPDDSTDDSTPRQLQVTLLSPFDIEANVLHAHTTGGYQSWYDVTIYDYDGQLPDSIEQYTINGPGISRSYTGADIAAGTDGLEYYPSYNEIFLSQLGTPQVGEYTFSVTIDGVTRTVKDMQHINRDLPVPDPSRFSVADGAVLSSKTPMFAWAPITGENEVSIGGAPIAYRLQVKDTATGSVIVSTPRAYGMTWFTVPENRLLPGGQYAYRVRASDSDDWLDVQNRSQSGWVPFSMAATLDHGSAPQFQSDWNALTWTTPSVTRLMGSVTVFDADGIASDGSSHQVSMQMPDGTWEPLWFYESYDNQTANYNSEFPLPTNWDATYNFQVSDPDGNSADNSDTIGGAPLDPIDPAQLRPSLYRPREESISATFDNVQVNGAPYDDFVAAGDKPDINRWSFDGNDAGITVESGALHLSTSPNVGRINTGIDFKDPAGKDEITLDVRVDAASSSVMPRARLHGYWFNQDGVDVWAGIKVSAGSVTYELTTDTYDETFHWERIESGTLKTVSLGDTVRVGIAWNGQHLEFTADEASYTYTPTGTILPARYPLKSLESRINLYTSVTPTFRWNVVSGAQRYRARVYSYDNARTIHRGYVNDGQVTGYTVPHGILRPDAYYRYRIEAWDVAGSDPDNISRTDRFRFYTGIPGDMDNDGFVDLSDGVRAMRALSGDGSAGALDTGDVDADGRVGTPEATYILQEVAGKR